jgi:A/G-specific adenine glycosylase
VRKPICRQPSKAKIYQFQLAISCWFKGHGRNLPWRKKSISKYQKIVVEVLLQRTRVESVASFFPSFVQAYPNWSMLAKATENDLQKSLKPIGLWRRRAVSLVAFAQAMEKRAGRFPRSREEIESLPSVGQYIANAILLFCHGESQPLLDGGMARVLERVFGERKLADIRDDPYLQRLAKAIVSCPDPISMNWAILDLASMICRPRFPKCSICPLREICRYARAHCQKGTSLLSHSP